MTFGTQGQGFPGSIWQILLFLMQVEEIQEIGHHVSPHLLYGHVQVSIIKQSVFWSNSYRYPIPLFMYLHAPHVSVILKYRSTDLHFALHWGGGEKKKKEQNPKPKILCIFKTETWSLCGVPEVIFSPYFLICVLNEGTIVLFETTILSRFCHKDVLLLIFFLHWLVS